MLRLEGLSKRFGARTILDSVSYHFPERTRISLVGANGAGKTTLLNILCDLEAHDAGRIIRPAKVRVGYLPQEPEAHPQDTVILECESGARQLHALEQEIRLAQRRMEEGHKDGVDRYERAETAYRLGGGYSLRARAEEILAGLGFTSQQVQESPLRLSGGWRMRLELAKVFINDPDFLILDEPTNHLDLPSLVWVEDYLTRFRGTLVFVSHDRALLNRLGQVTLHLSHGNLVPYQGSFDDFLEQREAKRLEQQQTKESIERRRADLERFVSRFGAKATKARQAQSRVKMIERLTELSSEIVPDADESTIHFALPEAQSSGREVLRLKALSTGYARPLASNINLTLERGQRIAIIGRNGIGKSTLLKTVAGDIPQLSGSIELGHNVRFAHFAQDQLEVMDPDASVLDTMLRTSDKLGERTARSLLGSFLFRGEDVFKEVKVLSGGEKSRLALARLLVAEANLLILDEPTNHLDMASVEMLVGALQEFRGSILFVSHDRTFIDALATHIFVMLPDSRHALFAGQLEDYQRLAAQTNFPDVLASAKPAEQASPRAPELSSPAKNSQRAREESKEKGRMLKRLAILEADQEKISAMIRATEDAIAAISDSGDFASLNPRLQELESLKVRLHEVEADWLDISHRLEQPESGKD